MKFYSGLGIDWGRSVFPSGGRFSTGEIFHGKIFNENNFPLGWGGIPEKKFADSGFPQ